MDLKEISSKIVLSQVISKYIKLIKKNSSYWGKCIFHKENTPSFAVNDEKEYYHCFGCGAHGNVFNFLMKVNDKSFRETLESLCETYNIPLKKFNNQQIPDENKIKNILAEAVEIYQKILIKSPEILKYLYNRGIDDLMIKTFSLGYANQNQVVLELMKKYSLEDIKNAGIISMGSYDRLRNRLIFPIFNEKKQCISFAGRTLKDENPKYINSNETDVFHKSLCLYNLNYISESFQQLPIIYLVEGYIDVITMFKYGYVNTVASMGTSVSKSQLFIILKRTKKICLIFDGDEAGEKAAERTVNILLTMINATYEVIICSLVNGEDPDSFLRNNMPKDIEKYYKNLFDYLIDNIIKNLDLKMPRDVSKAFERAYEYIHTIENNSLKASYKLLFENKLKDLIYEEKKKQYQNIKKKTIYISNREENIIMIIITYPELLHEFVEHLAIIAFKDFELDKIKNNLILHYNTSNFQEILNKFQREKRIINLLENNRLLLLKKDFCKKYLYDLLCLMPINNNDMKFI